MIRHVRRYVTNIEPIVPPDTLARIPKVDIYRYRKWNYIKPYKDTLSYEFKRSSFTVSSYNILSQQYLWPTVYTYMPLQYLNLKYRLGLLNQIYRQLDCDVMCFQEMEFDLYQRIWGDKSKYGVFHNYESMFIKKPKPAYWGEKPEQKMDGCSVFVKKSQFKILKYDSFQLRDRNFLPVNPIVEERLLSRNTVLMLVLLQHRQTNEIVFLTNTHLYWNPNFDDVKLLQTLILANELNKFIDSIDKNNKSVIMCGDFNSNSKSLVYKYLSKEMSGEYQEKIDKIMTEYGISNEQAKRINSFFKSPLTSSYPQDKYTVYTPHYKDAIDYIWYNSDKTESNLELVKILDGISTEYLLNEVGFPNDKYPSDHIPIVSQFHLRG